MDAIALVCSDCSNGFRFSAEEQKEFAQRGFSAPKRCHPCRSAKRLRQAARPAPAAAAAGGRCERSPTRPAFDRAARSAEPRPMHQALCTACGSSTEVPFVPDGVRPVYCLACLKRQTR